MDQCPIRYAFFGKWSKPPFPGARGKMLYWGMPADNSITRNNDTKRPQRSKFPPWIRVAWPGQGAVDGVRDVLASLSLNTVCRCAQCPNQGECWSRGTATFMILGDVCSRNCAFCGVSPGRPAPTEADEPARVAEAIRRLAIRHAVITSVTRDDLPDGGAAHFATVIRAVRDACPRVSVEVLTPDFGGDADAIKMVTDAAPDVFGHNVETVPRLHRLLRDPRASYERSLDVLRLARALLPRGCYVKSGLMAGCGETEAEVLHVLAALREAGCDAVTIGQYLKPRGGRAEIAEFIPPEQFARYEERAYEMGFRFAMAGPLVRSSYHAEALLNDTSPRNGDNVSMPPSNLA